MKTITEGQYLYLKAKKNAATLKNRTKEISDEEYEDLIQYSNKTIMPINNDSKQFIYNNQIHNDPTLASAMDPHMPQVFTLISKKIVNGWPYICFTNSEGMQSQNVLTAEESYISSILNNENLIIGYLNNDEFICYSSICPNCLNNIKHFNSGNLYCDQCNSSFQINKQNNLKTYKASTTGPFGILQINFDEQGTDEPENPNPNPGTEEPENPEPEESQDDHDYSQDYLTFEALEDGTFSFTINDLYYSTNNGTSWKSLAAGTSTELIAKGTKVLWKGNIINNSNNISHFRSTGQFNVLGNIMSLYYDSNFIGQIDITEKYYAFTNLFYNCSKLINAKYLVLPAIILEQDCYNSMFEKCINLITAPKLPALTLASDCYRNMFSGCTSLITAPELPATTLAESCYNSMFSGCTSLLSPIELPATTLSANCYLCMFYGCKKINYIKILISSLENYNGSLFNFLTQVSEHGIFIKYKNNINLDAHIPFGWTVQEIDPNTGEIVNEYINE